MCGRFALTLPKDAVRTVFGVTGGRAALFADLAAWPQPPGASEGAALDRPRYNIRPTEPVLAIFLDESGARRLEAFRWGLLPHWAKSLRDGPPLINARGETIAEKPAFRSAFASRRCLAPADGFYEWRALAGAGPKGKPLKEPHWIHPRASNAPLAFAGVWRFWRGPDGALTPSLALVTTAANAAMAPLHERLPVVIAPEDQAAWLGETGDAAAAAALIHAPPEDFYAHHPVSSRINKGGREAPDDADLTAPAPPLEAQPPEDPAQGSLF
ncbi:MAG: SOS response-associated peptidase [Pseudomonadota bacterium]